MKSITNYINEAWSGVKKQTNKANIEAWCDDMYIENYTINSKGEIDVNDDVDLGGKDFKELPYKFGKVNGYFTLQNCINLISLKNCPNYVGGFFSCSGCSQLDSLEGCPKKVNKYFYCYNCKRKFTKEEIQSLCKVKSLNVYITEAWNGVKKQSLKAETEAWCEEMEIQNYTINLQGEIDVNGYVDLGGGKFKELPYKFGKVGGYFNLSGCKNLISLKNCPNEVVGNFHCSKNENLVTLEGCPNELHTSFFCSGNIKLKSLKGCPKRVGEDFYCRFCGGQFDVQDVKKVCKVKGSIVV